MKKIDIKKYWKIKKRLGFHFYFVFYSVLTIYVTVTISDFITKYFNDWLIKFVNIPDIVVLLAFSLIIGFVLSFFVGKMLLSPINKLKEHMDLVSTGNFGVEITAKSKIDEVEDMYHYFNVMIKELRSTEIIQSDFISNVSHEIRTPLNAVEGYATLLTNKDLTEEEKNIYIDKILYNTKRMNKLISNILLLSKVDNMSIESNKKLYCLDEQIRQSIVFLEPKWSEKNIFFNVELEEVKYFGNEELMIHVWNNLISNAIKFSPNDGEISMSLTSIDNKIIFIIEDNGPGIIESDIRKIFNKFYQSDTSHKSEGNGLGLALVKKILDISHCEITVENKIPHGCKFIVVLYNDIKG